MKLFIYRILAVLVVMSGVSCGIIGGDAESRADSLETLLRQYQEENSRQSEMLKLYDNSIARFGNFEDSIRLREMAIDSLKSVIKSHGSATPEQNKELDRLVAQIKSYIAKNSNIAKDFKNAGYKTASAQQLLNMMFSAIDAKQKEVVALQQEISGLHQQVTNLRTENETLQSQNTELANEVAQTAKEKQEVTQDAAKLTLSAINIVLPDVRKAKKIETVDMKFNINENKYSQPQDVTVYVRITDKDGNVLRNNESGMFDYGGKSIAYTVKKNTFFSGNKTAMDITWHTNGITLTPGLYTVTFFMDGKEADQTTFLLKK